jgi:signal transduction histidine kinase
VTAVFTSPVRDVRGASLRVALIATGLVLVAYLLVAATVMMIVTRNLTTAVDARLQSYLSAPGYGQPTAPSNLPSTGAAYRDPLLRWIVFPGGQVYQVRGDSLVAGAGSLFPSGATSVGSPESLRLPDGSNGRFAGATIDIQVGPEVIHSVRLVVGQSTDNVVATQNNILIAEVIVGPILLIAVFLGALTVGRRVGSPIEKARQRQVALTADASHELRTPLSVIEAQTSLALERERDPEWYRRAFQAVGVESKRMRKLVDDLLWLARFDSAGATPGAEPVDLGVLAGQSASRFEAVAEARGQTLRVKVAPVLTVINAPPEWLDRLLGVLLDNATRYTPVGGVIEVAVERRDGRVRLAVEDSGPGIPPEERAHIFDRFHRASDTPGGSGLGLSIADAVVGASGGRWDVGISPSGGASMAVTWPPLTRGAGAVDSTLMPEPPAAVREVGAPPATSGSQA